MGVSFHCQKGCPLSFGSNSEVQLLKDGTKHLDWTTENPHKTNGKKSLVIMGHILERNNYVEYRAT